MFQILNMKIYKNKKILEINFKCVNTKEKVRFKLIKRSFKMFVLSEDEFHSFKYSKTTIL